MLFTRMNDKEFQTREKNLGSSTNFWKILDKPLKTSAPNARKLRLKQAYSSVIDPAASTAPVGAPVGEPPIGSSEMASVNWAA